MFYVSNPLYFISRTNMWKPQDICQITNLDNKSYQVCLSEILLYCIELIYWWYISLVYWIDFIITPKSTYYVVDNDYTFNKILFRTDVSRQKFYVTIELMILLQILKGCFIFFLCKRSTQFFSTIDALNHFLNFTIAINLFRLWIQQRLNRAE